MSESMLEGYGKNDTVNLPQKKFNNIEGGNSICRFYDTISDWASLPYH